MRITHVDDVPVNGTTGIFMTMKRVGEVQPVTVSATTRNRAGLTPAFSGGHRELMSAPFTIIHEPDKQPPNDRVHMNVFHAQMMELFAPSLRERTITAVMVDEGFDEPPTCRVRGRVVSFGRSDKEWRGVFLLLDPSWEDINPTISTANPLVVGGTTQTWPVVNLETGLPCKRQMLTIWDRTGHGVGSLMIAVTPAEDLPGSRYMVHCEGTPQPFHKVGDKLYFRVSVQADTIPTFIDIHMGLHVDGSKYYNYLEPFGVALDADVPNWRYNISTESAKDNGLSPALSWTPAVTGDPPPQRRYSFGMVGDWIHVRDNNVGEDLQSLGNDVDSLTLHTGVEARRITKLSIKAKTGYQPAESEGEEAGGFGKRKVMRCTLKVSSNLGPHYAQWSLGPTTFPRTTSETITDQVLAIIGASTIPGSKEWWQGRLDALDANKPEFWTTNENGYTTYNHDQYTPWVQERMHARGAMQNAEAAGYALQHQLTKTETLIWHRLFTVHMFREAMSVYFPTVSVSGGASGVYYLDFGKVDYEIPLMSMSIHPANQSTKVSWQRDVPPELSGMARTQAAAGMSSITDPGDVPGIFWESIWVDPVTKRPFKEDPATADLLPYAIRGQAKISVVYRRRDSPHFIEAWSKIVTSTQGETLHEFNNLSIETPGAVQIAVRIDPVSIQHSFANWGSFQITSVPQITLNETKVPEMEISEAINARVINGSLANLTTGESIRFDNVLVDSPGIRMDMQTGSITPLSGVGEWHGRIHPSAGSSMISLKPSSENDWAASGTIDPAGVSWSWHRRILV